MHLWVNKSPQVSLLLDNKCNRRTNIHLYQQICSYLEINVSLGFQITLIQLVGYLIISNKLKNPVKWWNIQPKIRNTIINLLILPSKSRHLLFGWKMPESRVAPELAAVSAVLPPALTTLWMLWDVVVSRMSTSPWLLSCVGVPAPDSGSFLSRTLSIKYQLKQLKMLSAIIFHQKFNGHLISVSVPYFSNFPPKHRQTVLQINKC